jgi:hypothetical protein
VQKGFCKVVPVLVNAGMIRSFCTKIPDSDKKAAYAETFAHSQKLQEPFLQLSD